VESWLDQKCIVMGCKREYVTWPLYLGACHDWLLGTKAEDRKSFSSHHRRNKTNKQKLQIVIKNKSSRDINSLREERSVISFPSLIGPYRNDHDIYESKRQNNPANEV